MHARRHPCGYLLLHTAQLQDRTCFKNEDVSSRKKPLHATHSQAEVSRSCDDTACRTARKMEHTGRRTGWNVPRAVMFPSRKKPPVRRQFPFRGIQKLQRHFREVRATFHSGNRQHILVRALSFREEQGRTNTHIPKNMRTRQKNTLDPELQRILEWLGPKLENVLLNTDFVFFFVIVAEWEDTHSRWEDHHWHGHPWKDHKW